MSFVKELLEYRNEVFVETGTYLGDTIELVAESEMCNEIRTIELSPYYYDMVIQRLKSKENIKFYFGNSGIHLSEIIQDIHVPITFWLDACWINVFHVGMEITGLCPILEELEQIKHHPIKNHTIMINNLNRMHHDDLRIKRIDVLRKLLDINPEYKIKYYADKNIIVAYHK